MAKKIVVPIVGEKGQKYDIVTMVEWKTGEGEKVDKGAVVLYMETEKASCDIEANSGGFHGGDFVVVRESGECQEHGKQSS